MARALMLVIAMGLFALLAVAWLLLWTQADAGQRRGGGQQQAIPVAVAAISQGPMSQRRVYSGTVEASVSFTVAPKVAGRLQRFMVDVGDSVQRTQVVAQLDDAEFIEEALRAKAELAVAEARVREMDSQRLIARRSFARIKALHSDGLTPVSELERGEAELLAAEAAHEVAQATVERTRSQLRTAQIRQSYTQVTAAWPEEEGKNQRLVTHRYLEAGDSVAVNDPLLKVEALDPVHAVFAVTERDYAQLQVGQRVSLASESGPVQTFAGEVRRLAPTFSTTSRLARVEVRVPNPDLALRPGMFVRLDVVLAHEPQATMVPADAVVRRAGEEVIFVVVEGDGDDSPRVVQRSVITGIRDASNWQVAARDGQALQGSVVVLGHQLVRDGSLVKITDVIGQEANAAPNQPETEQ